MPPMSDRPALEPADASGPALELILLCGALGSGKTTLLGQFLAGRDLRDTAVIVNEAGAVGIDAAVLQAVSPQDPVLLLDNGCVCCSLRSSLVQTLLDLLHRPRPDGFPPLRRVVIETSGISRPGPLLASLRDRDLLNFRPALRVVCTLDASAIKADAPASASDATDLLAQWAAAHRIVITRTDLEGALGLHAGAARARALNPLAEVIAEPDLPERARRAFSHRGHGRSQIPEAEGQSDEGHQQATPAQGGLLSSLLLQTESSVQSRHESSRESHHPRLLVLQGEPEAGLTWEAFAVWVDDLSGLLGDRLLRFKAVLAPSDQPQPLMLQGVGNSFSVPVPAVKIYAQMGKVPSIIVIARDTSPAEIASELPGAPVRLTRATPSP